MLAWHVTEAFLRLNLVEINNISSYGFPDPVDDRMLCLLLRVEWGRVAFVTTDLLLPNMYSVDLMGTPKYLSCTSGP